MMCEKCWADAYRRMMFVDPLKSQSEHYRELLKERRDSPCEHGPDVTSPDCQPKE